MAAAPTLPFVVLRAHKPCSVDDIISGQAIEQGTSLPGHSSPSSLNTRAPLRSSLDASPLSAPIFTGAAASPSSISSDIPRSGSTNTINYHTYSNDTGATSATAIHTRTIHPQVHFIFENDPLEMDILGSVPRSRCITLDLDPRTGTIKNVESFMPNLQVMDVKMVTSQLAPPTSSPLGSLNTLATTADGQSGNNTNTPPGSGSSHGYPTTLGRTGSSGTLPLQSSITHSTAASKMVRGSSDRSLVNQAADGDSHSIKGMTKDWGIVIEAVEAEEKTMETDSELLEQSMISSLDTDALPQDSLSYCEALLKSFSARNLLVKKVIDYNDATDST